MNVDLQKQDMNVAETDIDIGLVNKFSARDVHVFYGDNEAIKGVDLDVEANKVTALIGPSGCGKTVIAQAIGRRLQGHAAFITLDAAQLWSK